MRLVTPVEVSLWTTQTALMPVLAVGGQLLLDQRRVDAVPPVAGHELDLEPEPRRHLPPQRREMAGLEHEHMVARRQRVDQRRLPRPGARRRVDHDGAVGLEHPLHAGDDLLPERRRIPARDGRSSASRSPATPGRARWSAPGSAGNGGRYGAGAVFFIATDSLLLGRPSVGAKCDSDKGCDPKTRSRATARSRSMPPGTNSARLLYLFYQEIFRRSFFQPIPTRATATALDDRLHCKCGEFSADLWPEAKRRDGAGFYRILGITGTDNGVTIIALQPTTHQFPETSRMRSTTW